MLETHLDITRQFVEISGGRCSVFFFFFLVLASVVLRMQVTERQLDDERFLVYMANLGDTCSVFLEKLYKLYWILERPIFSRF